MDTITLNSDLRCDALTIPGAVVDRMISQANEAQLKIYLYLLRAGNNEEVTISSIADYFNYTEADVKRALKFWNGNGKSKSEKAEKVTKSNRDTVNDSTENSIDGGNVVAFSVRPSYSKEKMAEFAKIPEVSQLLFVAEQYMARPLKSDDIHSMLYMYDKMGFSSDLIEYLLEYCISNNKKSFRSIEMVASDWREAGVKNLEDAKRLTRTVPDEMKAVFAAFGMEENHQPIDAEIAYVRKWTEIFGYGIDIISQACQRTVLAISKPSFKYANSILKGWHDEGVVTLADIVASDERFKAKKANDSAVLGNVTESAAKKNTAKAKKNKFSNFSERKYDYESLMKDILSN